ncbi:hypothetical protein [Fructobacillus evanidus]
MQYCNETRIQTKLNGRSPIKYRHPAV